MRHPRATRGSTAGNRLLASSTVSTVTRCRALKMHARDFENLVIHDEDISHVLLGQLVKLLAERLRESNAKAATMTMS
jgi:CRP-like cAMP-binding protein